MNIRTKQEAVEKMKELKVNTFAQDIFDPHDLKKVKDFFDNNPASEYIIRDTVKASGKFYFVKDLEECKEKLKNYESKVTISVSCRDLKEHIVLLGDVRIEEKTDKVDLTARSDSEATQRNIYEKPEYNFHTDFEDYKLWQIPGFEKVANYISEHNLFNLVVEFALYDIPVGINNENVVLFEIRSNY